MLGTKERTLFLFIFIFSIMMAIVTARPTIYQQNENDKLEPVLLAVSSTVIPLHVYRVSSGVKVRSSKANYRHRQTKPEGAISLITADGLKKMKSLEDAKVKPTEKKRT